MTFYEIRCQAYSMLKLFKWLIFGPSNTFKSHTFSNRLGVLRACFELSSSFLRQLSLIHTYSHALCLSPPKLMHPSGHSIHDRYLNSIHHLHNSKWLRSHSCNASYDCVYCSNWRASIQWNLFPSNIIYCEVFTAS